MPDNDSRARRSGARKAGASVSIVGIGRWGSALALSLHAAGVQVEELVVRGTPDASQKKLARAIGAEISPWPEAKLQVDVVWLCVADGEIASVAAELASRWRNIKRPKVLLHSSGVLSSDVLAPARKVGVAVGSAHPFRSFPQPSLPSRKNILRGVMFGVEGEAVASKTARDLIQKMGGEAFSVPAKNKPLYHAFGSFASPLLVSLLASAQQVGEDAGIAPEVAANLLRSLAGGTFENWRQNGAAASFSGPISRGDSETIALHLTSLQGTPELDVIYRALTAYAIGHLPAQKRSALWAALARKIPKKRKTIKAVSQSKRVRR